MVDQQHAAVGQVHLLVPFDQRDQVDGARRMMDNADRRRGRGHECPVEPVQVLAHQAPGQVVAGLDPPSGRVQGAEVADPPVALGVSPVVEADAIARQVGLIGEGVQGDRGAGAVEQQIIGLGRVVDPGARGSGLDHVNLDLESGP